MSRPSSELLRPREVPVGDPRTRLLQLLAVLDEHARELERGAAMQPAQEELLAARRVLHGSPVVLLQCADEQRLHAFLRRTLQLHSQPPVALDSLPARTLLRLDDHGRGHWRLLLTRSESMPTAAARPPAYLRIDIDAVVARTSGPEARVRPPAEGDEDGEWTLPFGADSDALRRPLDQFWSSPLFTNAALVECLRAQVAQSAAAAALEALKRRVLLARQELLLVQSQLRVQEPRRLPVGAARSGDGALRLVSDTVSELIASVREHARRAAARGSWLWSFQANALGQISRESIARDERRRITRLAVNEEQIRGIEASFLRTFRGMLGKQLEALRSELDALCRTLEQQLDLTPRTLVYDFPGDQSLWHDVAGHAAVDVRYRGEIQRRGFMERLAEGRKVVFLLLMVGSLAGSFVGFNLRQSGLIGIVCLVLFVGTIAWSYKSWSDEENELIDRETDKLADLVEAAIVKATTEALREAANHIVAALEGVRKQLLARIDAILERAARTAEGRVAEEQREQQARLQRTEAGLRQLAGLEPQLLRHTQAAEALAAELARALQSALRMDAAR